jgi:hypothetical protein
MGVDTRLIVSPRWRLEDIKAVMENYLKTEVKVEDCTKTCAGMFRFLFKLGRQDRMMHIHTYTRTPLGSGTELSLGHNEQAVVIMKTIAKVLGGFLLPQDFDNKYEWIEGVFAEEDGLNYFYKYAVLHNELANENDLVGLNESIHKWFDDVTTSRRSKMNLFPRQEAMKCSNS